MYAYVRATYIFGTNENQPHWRWIYEYHASDKSEGKKSNATQAMCNVSPGCVSRTVWHIDGESFSFFFVRAFAAASCVVLKSTTLFKAAL